MKTNMEKHMDKYLDKDIKIRMWMLLMVRETDKDVIQIWI